MIPGIIALLEGGPFKRVDEAEELAAIATEATAALPAAFVLEEGSTATDFQSGSNIYEQIVTTTVGVVIITGADGARRGGGQLRLRELSAFVVGRLFAADVEGLSRPLAFAGAQLVAIQPGRLSAILRFRAVSRRRVTRV
jgi:hypothetical protein